MMTCVVKQDNVMHDGFQDATSADERPKAWYVTIKVFVAEWYVWCHQKWMAFWLWWYT